MTEPAKNATVANADAKILYHDLDTLKEIIFTRLEAMDKAVNLFQENLTRVPTDVDKQVGTLKELVFARLDCYEEAVTLLREEKRPNEPLLHLRELVEEKFASIAIQFKERDTRTESSAKDSKVAVDAALQAAKEAVSEQNKSSALAIGKSEASTSKQIDQIAAMSASTNSATNDKIDDIKERLTLIEGRSKGSGESWGTVMGIIGVLISLAALVVVIVATMKH
jgi:hypothetical protein